MNLIVLLTLLVLCLCGLLALHLYLPSFILSNSSSTYCDNLDTEEERAECAVNPPSSQKGGSRGGGHFSQVDKERRAFIVHFQMNAPDGHGSCSSSTRSSSLDLFFKGVENTIASLNEEFSPPLSAPAPAPTPVTQTPNVFRPMTSTQNPFMEGKKVGKNGTTRTASSSANKNSSKTSSISTKNSARTPPPPSINQTMTLMESKRMEDEQFKKPNIEKPVVSVTNLPFVVAIVYFESARVNVSARRQDIKLLCGGSVLDATHVLTSARCLPKIANFMASGHCVQAWIGMSGWDVDFYGAKINVALAYQHIGYKFEEWGSRHAGGLVGGGRGSGGQGSGRDRDQHVNESRELRGNYWNDIAILQLEMPIENHNYFTICVGGPWRRYDKVTGFVAGFETFSHNFDHSHNFEGTMSPTNSISQTDSSTRRLIGAEETIFEHGSCNNQLEHGHNSSSASAKPVTSDRQVCTSQTAGYGEPERGTMIGGPLFMKIGKNEYIQVGIISYNLTAPTTNVQNELQDDFDLKSRSNNSTRSSTGHHHHHHQQQQQQYHWVYTKTATFQNFIQQFAPGARFC